MKSNMRERFNVISQNTLVPISLIILIGGAVAWLTTMYVDISYMKKQVEKIDDIAYDVAVIKQQLKDNETQLGQR